MKNQNKTQAVAPKLRNKKRDEITAKLRDIGHLGKKKGSPDYNLPTQVAIKCGWLKLVETAGVNAKGKPVINKVTRVTPKGQQYYLKRFGSNSRAA